MTFISLELISYEKTMLFLPLDNSVIYIQTARKLISELAHPRIYK